MQLFTALLAALLATACSSMPADDNPFGTHYVKKATSASSVRASGGDPRIFRGTDREEDNRRLVADGYQLIGTSDFQAGDVSPDQALEQARRMHADVVLVYTKLAGRKLVPAGQSPAAVESVTADSEHKRHALDSPGKLIPIEENLYRYFASFWVKLVP